MLVSLIWLCAAMPKPGDIVASSSIIQESELAASSDAPTETLARPSATSEGTVGGPAGADDTDVKPEIRTVIKDEEVASSTVQSETGGGERHVDDADKKPELTNVSQDEKVVVSTKSTKSNSQINRNVFDDEDGDEDEEDVFADFDDTLDDGDVSFYAEDDDMIDNLLMDDDWHYGYTYLNQRPRSSVLSNSSPAKRRNRKVNGRGYESYLTF